MIYLAEIFWRHSWDVGKPVPNDFEFLLCLSVCLLAHILMEIMFNILFTQVRDVIFWSYSWDVCKLNPIKYISLVCLSLFYFYSLWLNLMTFGFWYSAINFDTLGLVTFWFSWFQLLRPRVLVNYLQKKVD